MPDESSFAGWAGKSQLARETILHDLEVTNRAAAEAVMGVEGSAPIIVQINALREAAGIDLQVGPDGVIEEG